jgi:hypothetical protein
MRALTNAVRSCSRVGAAILLVVALSGCSSLGIGNSARVEKAKEMMAERCKWAGEKIYRTVSDVDGIFLIKVRPAGINYGDQFKLDDPYGRDLGGENYIGSFLGGRFSTNSAGRGRLPESPSFLYVEANDSSDGRRYRYTGAVRDVVHTSSMLIGGDGSKFTTRDFVVDKALASGEKPRYGVTYDDISTREEREYWIAGSSLKVIDLQTGEAIAERIGYMVDMQQGDRTGGRAPWLMAARYACPEFGGGNLSHDQALQASRFVFKVLTPGKEGKQ